MTSTTLADPMFASIFNKGESTMNDQIICETTEEHSHPTTPSTTIPSSLGQGVPIQGVSGNSYAPMDTSPVQTNPQLTHLFKQLQDTITAIIQLSTTHQQTQAQTDLVEAVDVALGNADWFKDRLADEVCNAVEEKDFDYEIGQNIERYMRNSFDANDHYDFDSEVKSRVEDELESVIDGLVADAVEERITDKVYAYLDEYLESVIKERLQDANITIKF